MQIPSLRLSHLISLLEELSRFWALWLNNPLPWAESLQTLQSPSVPGRALVPPHARIYEVKAPAKGEPGFSELVVGGNCLTDNTW